VVSDNAKTFAFTAQILQDVLRSPVVQQYFAGMNIQWVFNLEKTPWWGRFFERLVQSRLSYDELPTLLTDRN